jgi:Fic family protein
MNDNLKVMEEMLRVLKDIRRGISLLGSTQQKKALESLNQVRGKRKKMYKMFNGKTSLEEIAKRLKTTHENVRLFSIECQKNGLVEFVKGKGRLKYPKKII